MIDSHCHIGIGEEAEKGIPLSETLNRAKNAGISHILTVACSFDDIDDLKAMLTFQNVYGAFGIHPENCLNFSREGIFEVFEELPELIALGEIGLDYFYEPETRQKQIHAFENQIEIADRLNLPIIIHTRDAEDDTISILKSAKNGGLLKKSGVLHCFTGTQRLADFALDMDLYISASGIITFKNAQSLRDIFQCIPSNRLLIETDSPYLAPVPYRGKVNEPAYVIETAKCLADIKSLNYTELGKITTDNFNHLFIERKNR